MSDSHNKFASLVGSQHLSSRIFWRITAGIFFSIVCIEIVLLVYSWFTERERLVHRLDETIEIVAFSLDTANPVPQLERFQHASDDAVDYQMLGFRALSPSGERFTSGGLSAQDFILPQGQETLFDAESGSYLKYIALDAPAVGASETARGWQLWVRLDASSISTYMQWYVFRIVAMVVLISAFVTIAALVFLRPMLIAPLLRLDRLLVRGQSNGIEKAIAAERDLQRPDELGRLFRSFEVLRQKLIDSEQQRERITERFERFASLGADSFWEMDRNGTVTFFSGDSNAFWPVAGESPYGKNIRDICAMLRDRVDDIDSLPAAIRQEGAWCGDYFPTGESKEHSRHFKVVGAAIVDEHGQTEGYRGTIQDVTKETALSRELTFYATHDELTGLRNRRELSATLDSCVEQFHNKGTVASLAILDLDHFKYVNDSAGHAAGDALLCVIADTFRSHVPDDCLFRLGGDEFAVVFKSGGINTAIEVLEAIRHDVHDLRFHWGEDVFSVSVTAGLAALSGAIDSSSKLSLAADSCCIDAKRDGKNTVLVFNEQDQRSILAQSESVWTSRILHAIEHDEFELFQQSIKHIHSLDRGTFEDDEEHFEILIRMKNDEGGYWPPNEFLPAAERFDLMPRVDQWVVDHSLAWLEAQDLTARPGFLMNINLSAASLANPAFHRYLLERTRDNLALNAFVCFEVTESAAIINLDMTVGLLAGLRELGCSVALDDFGTGFSSLSHIRQLPLDYIKIDGTFIQHIVDSDLDQTVVKSVADIAKVLQIKTVAEFVDSPEALELLATLDIDYAQGFLFSRPEKLGNSPKSEPVNRAA